MTPLAGTLLGHEAARALARLLRSAHEHGAERVREALHEALASGSFDELAVQRLLTTAEAGAQAEVAVPETLRGYEVEHASAAVYDRLLPGGAL